MLEAKLAKLQADHGTELEAEREHADAEELVNLLQEVTAGQERGSEFSHPAAYPMLSFRAPRPFTEGREEGE